MLSAMNSPLIADSLAKGDAVKTYYGKVIRAFRAGKRDYRIGEYVELPATFAQEMKSANKFVFCQKPEPPKQAEAVVEAPPVEPPKPKSDGKPSEPKSKGGDKGGFAHVGK